jgi:type I restriction-modification system DNA methylase subunit
MGAPMALFAFANCVEVWPVVSPSLQTPEKPERLSYKRLPKYFRQHREELAPRSLLNAKQGSRQLSFMDVDSSLESFARATTKKTLTKQFTQAIASIPYELRTHYPEDITRLAIWILAARILQDKLGYQHDVYSDFRAVKNVVPLLETAQDFFPNYFTGVWEHLAQVGTEALDSFYEGLSREFTFRSLTNDMLAYFYENTLVSKEMRKSLGVYYTPQKTIAERILHRLPIEDLPLEKRTVLDGTCGSGNLLLAAYDRLRSLLPHHWTSQQRHEYLLQRVWGIDIDPFACEIARLSLLLYSLPEGDSWQVKTSDVLQDTPQNLFSDRPSVIVGNPPFKEPRSVGGQRVQTAALVLDRYLEWLEPNGLLGVVVPITFLQTLSYSSALAIRLHSKSPRLAVP